MTDNPRIGKDVIESLTLGMYEDCRFIYREYIQNSADQVDKAVAEGLINAGEDEIHITINPKERCIVIEDNATGISSDKVIPILSNIAHSTKKRGEDKGFRGIGRLGGLGYCSKLIFETTFAGEEVKSIMTWDADLLKQIINDRDNSEEAVDVLARVTDTIHKKEAADKHYFKVILENVTSDELLNVERVKNYLSMVAPVDISSQFIYRSQINKFIKDNGLKVDAYNIYINEEQIYKPYTTHIYKEIPGSKKAIDDILGVGVQFHLTGLLQGLEGGDRPGELHAVGGGLRLSAGHLLLMGAVHQDGAPAPGSRIAGAGPVGVNGDCFMFLPKPSHWGRLSKHNGLIKSPNPPAQNRRLVITVISHGARVTVPDITIPGGRTQRMVPRVTIIACLSAPAQGA